MGTCRRRGTSPCALPGRAEHGRGLAREQSRAGAGAGPWAGAGAGASGGAAEDLELVECACGTRGGGVKCCGNRAFVLSACAPLASNQAPAPPAPPPAASCRLLLRVPPPPTRRRGASRATRARWPSWRLRWARGRRQQVSNVGSRSLARLELEAVGLGIPLMKYNSMRGLFL